MPLIKNTICCYNVIQSSYDFSLKWPIDVLTCITADQTSDEALEDPNEVLVTAVYVCILVCLLYCVHGF